MTDLLKLAGRVEAGEYVSATTVSAALKMNLDKMLINTAIRYGSLDAAQALHDAVLPGWHVDIHAQEGFNNHVVVSTDKPLRHIKGRASTAAAAWVAAILRAKASMEEKS